MAITVERSGFQYAIELDGAFAGWVREVSGGDATADVITEKIGPDWVVRKHIGSARYEDITINCGAGMSKGFYEWIGKMLTNQSSRKNGAIVMTDYNYAPVSRLEFSNALLSDVAFPALDAAAKDPARMTIKIAPEYTRLKKGGSSSAPLKSDAAPRAQKQWVSSNFRLTIDAVDCSRVSKIDAITIRQVVAENSVGQLRDPENFPTHLDIANLAVTVAESGAQDFYNWHEDFVVKGNAGQDGEKNATIEMLSTDLKTVLFTLTLKHLGIYRLAQERSEPSGDAVRRLRAEMYCEETQFDYSGAVE
jgi:phage tail-like protein